MSFFTNTNNKQVNITITETPNKDLKITPRDYLQIVRELNEYFKKFNITKQNFTYYPNIELLSTQDKINWDLLRENGKSLLLMLSEIFGVKIEFFASIKEFIVYITMLISYDTSFDIITNNMTWDWYWWSDINENIFNTIKKELIKCRKRRRICYNTKIINYFELHMRDIFIKYINFGLSIDVFVNIFKYIDFNGCIHCKNDCKPIDTVMSHDSVNCVCVSKNLHCKYCYAHGKINKCFLHETNYCPYVPNKKCKFCIERGTYIDCYMHYSNDCDCNGLFTYMDEEEGGEEEEEEEDDYKLVTEYNFSFEPFVFNHDFIDPNFLEPGINNDFDFDFDLINDNLDVDIINHGDNNMWE